MKIENDSAANVYLNQAAPTERAANAAPSTSGAGGVVAQGDAVTVSPEARVAQSALDAAAALPATRQDVVDRMRALNNSGALGQDANHLADSIIDSWLSKP